MYSWIRFWIVNLIFTYFRFESVSGKGVLLLSLRSTHVASLNWRKLTKDTKEYSCRRETRAQEHGIEDVMETGGREGSSPPCATPTQPPLPPPSSSCLTPPARSHIYIIHLHNTLWCPASSYPLSSAPSNPITGNTTSRCAIQPVSQRASCRQEPPASLPP